MAFGTSCQSFGQIVQEKAGVSLQKQAASISGGGCGALAVACCVLPSKSW